MTKLSGNAVSKIFRELLFKEGEDTSSAVMVEGVIHKFGLHPERLAANKDKVKELLDQLPDEFKQSGGGGWSFLNMCYDKEGNQWTGLHLTMEELVVMGLAHDLISFSLPREMWSSLPGGMPYLMVKDVEKVQS